MFTDFPFAIVAAPLLAAFVSYLSNLWLVRLKMSSALDHPNSRSLHVAPVPRVGGLGLLSGLILGWVVFSMDLPFQIWLGIILLTGISGADDLLDLPIWCRLIVHSLVAALFSFLTFDTYSWYFQLLLILSIIWIMNLYNFMDGADGLAGGMALIGFSYYGLVALFADHIVFAIANFVVAAAALGFLILNFHPARIFMGDAGSVPLGYLAATMGLLGWFYGLWSLLMPLLIFSPFIADASVTLIKRFWRGEKIWQAHREHYYQRMVRSGLGHRNTALISYGLMLITGACAVWMNFQEMALQWIVVMTWGFIYLGLMMMADLGRKLYMDDI